MEGDDLLNKQLYELREQGMHVTTSAISALADIIGEQMHPATYLGRLGLFLDHYAELWQQRVENLRTQTGLDDIFLSCRTSQAGILHGVPYAVLQHPVFALKPEVSQRCAITLLRKQGQCLMTHLRRASQDTGRRAW